LLAYSDLLNVTAETGFPAVVFPQSQNLSVPAVAGGVLWPDQINNRFYSFGGDFMSETPSSFATWTYSEQNSTWDIVPTLGDKMHYLSHGMSAVAQDAGISYYLGGYQDNTTDQSLSSKTYSSGLISFDMVQREYSTMTGPDGNGRGEGIMVFIPASTSGLLVYFGGVVQANNGDSLAAVNDFKSFGAYSAD
jgi:hypothetical protein